MRYIFLTNLRAFELAGGQNRHGQQERHPADNQQRADDQHRPARVRRTCCGNRWPDRGNRVVFIRAFGLLLSGGRTARHHSLLPPDHAPQLFPPDQSLGQRQLAVRPVDTLARCASEEAAHMAYALLADASGLCDTQTGAVDYSGNEISNRCCNASSKS